MQNLRPQRPKRCALPAALLPDFRLGILPQDGHAVKLVQVYKPLENFATLRRANNANVVTYAAGKQKAHRLTDGLESRGVVEYLPAYSMLHSSA